MAPAMPGLISFFLSCITILVVGVGVIIGYPVIIFLHFGQVFDLMLHGAPKDFKWDIFKFTNHVGCNSKSQRARTNNRGASDNSGHSNTQETYERMQRERAEKEQERREQARQREQRRRYVSPLPQTFAEACEVLGVAQGLPKAEYKKAYRKKALEYHTDKFQDAGEKIRMVAEEEMKRINTAWDIINRDLPG